MAGTVVRKNGKAYDSGDVVISYLGTVDSEVKSITYTTDQDHQVNHSLSNDATSWSMGKKQSTCSIELYMNSVRKLEKKAGGDLLRLAPFDIQVTFINEFNELINDTVTVKFKQQGRTVTGDMGLAQNFEMFCLGVDYNNA